MKKNKRIARKFKKGNDEYIFLDKIFNSVDEKTRLSYIYAVCLIQTTYFFLFNRPIEIDKIHHYFLTDYLPKNVDENWVLSFNYLDIGKSYIEEKSGIKYEKFEKRMLERLSRLYNQKFNNIEEYLEYYINKRTNDETFKKISNFISTGKEYL